MSRFSYEDQCHQVAVLVDGEVTGHIVREGERWFYRVRGTTVEGHRHVSLGDVIAELEAAPVDWAIRP